MRKVAALAATVLLAAALPPAAGPVGTFEVVAAPRNQIVTNPQGQYRPDDPQLVNRLVRLTPTSVAFDGDAKTCTRAAATTQRLPLGRVLRQVIPDERKYGRLNVARPRDFGIALAPGAVVPVTRYRCVQPLDAHGAEWNRAVSFPIDGGRVALFLVGDHLLILRPAAGPIRASFACARAGSPAERTICADRQLAGWDRSVAAAYREGRGDVADQRAWLAERDRCGADRACLLDAMSLRTANLLH